MSGSAYLVHGLERSVLLVGWRTAQALTWLAALWMLTMLAVSPHTGLHAMWDVLLPAAPALMALLPGVWRNICPLGTTSQLARHFGISAARQITESWQIAFQTTRLALLLLIVPLRHLSLNVDALATLTVLLAVGVIALAAGFAFDGKSGWCGGSCPVHPVEKLYGHAPAITVKNAHCAVCVRCTSICPDSTKSMNPLLGKYRPWRRASAWLLVGGFPGYIWGWFHVPDAVAAGTVPFGARFAAAYGLPLGAMVLTLSLYIAAMKMLPHRCGLISRGFAAAAISTYYWYRIPGLIGFGVFPGDGMLVDLRGVASPGALLPIQLAITAFWVWWLVPPHPSRAWQIRPAFARP